MIDLTRIKLILIILSFLGSNRLFAQDFKDKIPSKTKNAINLSYGLYTFYDGMPITHKSAYNGKTRLSRGFGISYLRMTSDKRAWSLSTNLYFYLLEKKSSTFSIGTVTYKNFMTGQFDYYMKVYATKTSSIFASAGLMFRGGYESVHGGWYGPAHAYVQTHIMLDAGIPIGLNYMYYLGKHLHVNLELEHTVFPFIYSSRIVSNYLYRNDWGKGASRNMTKLQVGFGVNF
ncbi:hypothetical protein [Crocinitomix algicola]|uniref:hypothetical protein n=1 Tax=Crocinitomix algicola TaxID=1740263 RepID=UPI00082C90E3|nr:hypothetical protein [Crocinitomix algicola]